MQESDRRAGYLMIAPVCVFLALIMVYPMFQSLLTSLTDRTVGSPGHFIGLKNYRDLLRNDLFIQAVENTAIYVVATVVAKTILGMILALLIEGVRRGRPFLRALVLLPWVVPTSMSVLAWQWMFDPTYSVANWFLTHVGIPTISWLGDPSWARFSVMAINVWRGTPFFAIGLAAGLTSIPRELYESASMDGAGETRKFFRITLPLVIPVFSIVLLYSIVQTISDFEIVFVLTRGGPLNSTHLLGTLAYQIGLAGTELGKGSAISLFIFPILLVSAFFAIRTVTRDGKL